MIPIEIKNSITKMLKAEYPDHKIYDEKVEQGLKRPCFFVDVIPIDIEKINPELQSQSIMVDIQFMSMEETKAKNLEKSSELPQVFQFVSLEDGKRIQLANERFELIDGILHYLFDLDFIVKLSPNDTEPMIGEIKLNREVN